MNFQQEFFMLMASQKSGENLLLYGGYKKYSQLVKNGNFADNSNWVGSITILNNIGTYQPTGAYQQVYNSFNIPIIQNHKYLLLFELKTTTTSETTVVKGSFGANVGNVLDKSVYVYSSQDFVMYGVIATGLATQNIYISFSNYTFATNDKFEFKNIRFIDLTADNHENFTLEEAKAYYGDSYLEYTGVNGGFAPYTTPFTFKKGATTTKTYAPATPIDLLGIGEVKSLLGVSTTFTFESRSSANVYIYNGGASLQYGYANVKVIGSHKYVFGVKISATNNLSLFSGIYKKTTGTNYSSLTSYIKDNYYIAICTAVSDFDNCEIYIRNDNYMEVGDSFSGAFWFDLTSAGLDTLTAQQFYEQYNKYFSLWANGDSAFIKLNDTLNTKTNKISKNCNMVDLGTLNYTYVGTSYTAYSTGIQNDAKRPISYAYKANAECPKYKIVAEGSIISEDKSIAITSGGILLLKDTDLTGYTPAQIKTALSGIYLIYELATPTEITLTEPVGKIAKGTTLVVDMYNSEIYFEKI